MFNQRLSSIEITQEQVVLKSKPRWLLKTNTGANFIIYTGESGFVRVASPCCGGDMGIVDIFSSKKNMELKCDVCLIEIDIFKNSTIGRVNMIPGSKLDKNLFACLPLQEYFNHFLSYFLPPMESIIIAAELEEKLMYILEKDNVIFSPTENTRAEHVKSLGLSDNKYVED